MQRALSAPELTGSPLKPKGEDNKISPSASEKTMKTDTPLKMDSQIPNVQQMKGGSTTGSPQKTQTSAVTQASEDIKGPESAPRASPTPSQIAKIEPVASNTTESMSGKMFGFGSSIFSSASTLISSAVQDESRTTPPGSRKLSAPAGGSPKMSAVPKISPAASPKMSPAKDTKTHAQIQEQEKKPEESHQSIKDKVPPRAEKAPNAGQATCPLCKVELNCGSKDPPNYNTCTQCKTTVCNQCGFNPMPGEVSLCTINMLSHKLNDVLIYCMNLHNVFQQKF